VTILDEILAHKREEVARAQRETPLAALRALARHAGPTRGFGAALAAAPHPRIVAEIKHKSPSRGVIRADFDPVSCAKAYAEAGAAALSVLTDERYFGGHLDCLESVRGAVSLPLLRKDFIVDAYQIAEARARGADAVLLIAAAFPGPGCAERLRELRAAAGEQALDALVEVHDELELDAALASGADLIGINNRDLKTFRVDLGTTERLAARIGGRALVVAESGIGGPEDISRLAARGAAAFLVGESLMREADLGAALRRLRRVP
jgi:indole-3-glycerol phosphate synthase